MLVVRREIHSSSGKLKKMRHASRDFSRHFTAEGNWFSQSVLNSGEELRGFLPGRGIEDGSHLIGHRLFELLGHLGQHIPGHMNLAALDFGFGEFFFEDFLKTRQAIHDPEGDFAAIKSTSFQILEKLSPVGCRLLISRLQPQNQSRTRSRSLQWPPAQCIFSMESPMRISKFTPSIKRYLMGSGERSRFLHCSTASINSLLASLISV